MSEWRKCKLGDLTTNIDYGYTASAKQDATNAKFLRITDITNKRVNWETVPHCDISDNNFKKYLLELGDIVIARTGATTGSSYTIKSSDPKNVVFASYLIRYRINKSIADPFFIDFCLRSSFWQSYVDGIAGGSAQPGANAKQLANFEINLPPLPEQKAIAEVLTSLDDKIDLLHRQNKTLEQLAETLFRHHFIDNAKDDWEEKNLLDLIKIVGGGTPKTSVPNFWDGDVNWLSGGDIASNHKSFISSSEKTITEDGLESSSAKLLPKFATIISARGTVGKFALLSKPMAFSQSNYGILPQVKDCFFFTYLLINHAVSELQSSAYGSVFDTITTNTFKEVSISVPKDKCIQEFERNISSYFLKKLVCVEQIQVLQKTRDQLLPKLMRGEIKISGEVK